MQSVEDPDGDDLPRLRYPLDFSGSFGDPRPQSLMRTHLVEVPHVFANHPIPLPLAENQRLKGRPMDR